MFVWLPLTVGTICAILFIGFLGFLGDMMDRRNMAPPTVHICYQPRCP